MIKKVAFTMYPVIDMARARHFYEETLQLTPGTIGIEGAWVEYDVPGGGCFAITTVAKELKPSANSAGIAFEVDDLDALVTKLKNAGVTFKLDTFATPVCRMAVIIDSEGNAVMLHQLKKHS